MKTHNTNSSVAFGPLNAAVRRNGPAKSKVGLLGTGHVTRERYWPALRTLQAPFEKVAVCGFQAQSPLAHLPHQYFQLEPRSLLPLDQLEEAGFLDEHTIWINLTPPNRHVESLMILGGLVEQAVEKPLAQNCRQAALLRPFIRRSDILPLDHKLFCAGSLRARGQLRPELLSRVRRIEGVFHETRGWAPNRHQVPTMCDVITHLFSQTVALYANLAPFTVLIEDAIEARHLPNHRFSRPEHPTASLVRGLIVPQGQEPVSFQLAQAKAAPKTEKYMRFFDENGLIVQTMDLNESGSQPHSRLLQALKEPEDSLHLSLEHAIGITELIDICRAISQEVAPYRSGRWPEFMAHQASLIA